MTFFSNRPSFSDFPLFTVIKCPIKKPLFQKKNSLIKPFFTLLILSHTSNNTTSLNIWGPIHGPSPHLKFWGTFPPCRSPPLGPSLLSNLLDSEMMSGQIQEIRHTSYTISILA